LNRGPGISATNVGSGAVLVVVAVVVMVVVMVNVVGTGPTSAP